MNASNIYCAQCHTIFFCTTCSQHDMSFATHFTSIMCFHSYILIEKTHIPAAHSWLPPLWPYRRPRWEKCWERYAPEQEHPSHLYDPELPADEPFINIKMRESQEITNKLTSRDHFSCPLTFIPVMKLIFFSNLFQYDSFGSLSTNQKAEIWMLSTQFRNDST